MGCCSCLSKTFLVLFNIVFFLVGLVPLVLGIIALVSEETLEKVFNDVPGLQNLKNIVDLQELIVNFAVAFIVIGAIVAVLGFLGGCGACCKSKCLLKLYLLLVVLILLAEIAVIIVAVAFPETFDETGETILKKNFYDVGDCNETDTGEKLDCGKASRVLAWHTMQFELKCCGPTGYQDYNSSTDWFRRRSDVLAPATCCKHNSTEKLQDSDFASVADCYFGGTTSDEYNKQGCFDAIVDWAVTSAIFIGVMAGVGAIELLLIVATIVELCTRSRNSKAA